MSIQTDSKYPGKSWVSTRHYVSHRLIEARIACAEEHRFAIQMSPQTWLAFSAEIDYDMLTIPFDDTLCDGWPLRKNEFLQAYWHGCPILTPPWHIGDVAIIPLEKK